MSSASVNQDFISAFSNQVHIGYYLHHGLLSNVYDLHGIHSKLLYINNKITLRIRAGRRTLDASDVGRQSFDLACHTEKSNRKDTFRQDLSFLRSFKSKFFKKKCSIFIQKLDNQFLVGENLRGDMALAISNRLVDGCLPKVYNREQADGGLSRPSRFLEVYHLLLIALKKDAGCLLLKG